MTESQGKRPGASEKPERGPGRWRIAALFGGIAASWALFTLGGRAVVRLIYDGKAPAFLNAWMTNREGHPVSHFYEIVDDPVLALHLIFVVVALVWLTRARRSPWLWFALLVAGDVGLLLLDIKSRSVFLKIWHERSVPEWFGYYKEILFAVSMYGVFKIGREKIYACLSLFGCMLFLDDAAGYHEFVGRRLEPVVEATGLHQVLAVESHYLGEVLSLVPYGILALAGFWFYLRSAPETRRNARFAAILIGLLFAFGVLVDLIPHLGRLAHLPQPPFSMAWIEDFGEMIILSGLAAFSAAVLWSRGGR